MPDIKEKLVELLNNSFAKQYEKHGLLTAPHTADDLIANGVTIQRWISVEDRLPTKEDADENEGVLAVYKLCGLERYWPWEVVAKYPEQFLYWMRTPALPKGE